MLSTYTKRTCKIFIKTCGLPFFIFLVSLISISQASYGQCTNADFSDGNFTGWTGTYGIDYNNGNCIYSMPYEYTGFLQGPNNYPSNSANNQYCQIITTGAGNDPFLAANGINLPIVHPGGGTYSARIGNTWPNSGQGLFTIDATPDAETITYSYTVTAATAGFTYYYLPILNVGSGHLPSEQPFFKIRMLDALHDTITCASFDVDASNAASVGGFSHFNDNSSLAAGKVYYKNWTPVYIPLTNYIGQTVSITFITNSCNPGGCAGTHFAIAYIDAQCGPIALTLTPTTTCSSQTYTITAPAGAATYTWTGPGISNDTTQTITATQSGHYHVSMTTFGSTPCTFTLDTTITLVPPTGDHANFSAPTVCLGSPTVFTDLSTPTGAITHWAWDFNNSGTTNSTLQNPSYTFATAGTHAVKLTIGVSPCTVDTIINVVVSPQPTSTFTVTGPVCTGQTSTITYTGNGTAANTYTWNFNGGTIVSGSGMGPYQVSWSTPGTKSVTLTVSAGTCTSPLTTNTITVTASPTMILTPDINICPGGTATLAPVVSPTGGTYAWSTTQTTSSITVSPATTTHYSVVYTLGTCTATAADTVIVTSPNAGPDKTVTCAVLPGGTATMSGSGGGTWAPLSGPGNATITTPNSPTTTITNFSLPGTYQFTFTSGTCADTAAIVVTAKPDAGPDQAISCVVLPGGSVTMGGSGSGTWTAASAGNPGIATITAPTSPTTTITNFPVAGTYKYVFTNASGCTDTASIVVTAKPNAGPDKTVTCAVLPGGSATMAGSGTGTWSLAPTGNAGTATITSTTLATTTVTGFTAAGVYTLIWTNASGCTDTALITVTAKPNAGPDQSVLCAILPGGTATMAGSGTGTWTQSTPGTPGNATITNSASPTTTITGFTAAGIYTFIWTNASGCTDTALVTVTAKPNAGPDQTVSCAILPGGSASMAATGTGTWSAAASGNPGTATIASPTSATTTISGYPAAGVYSFIWTNASGCTDTALVTVTAKPNAGPDQTVTCAVLPGGSATMGGSGAGTWTALTASNPGTATITNPTSTTTTITTFSAPGIYTFILTNAAGCTDTALITVTAKPNAGPDQIVTCAILPGGSATMAGSGLGTWTPASTGNAGTATIASSTSPTTTISGFTAPGTYHFIWTNASGCTDTAAIVVTAKPNAGPDQSVLCALLPGGSATMGGSGSGTWTAASSGNPGTAVITAPTSSTTTITTFSAPGTYTFIWTNASGCTDTALITVTQEPTITLPNASYCLGGTATLSTTVSPAGGTYLWSTGATTPSITTDTTVTSHLTVTYTLGSCAASAVDTVTVNPLPLATVTTIPTVCTAQNGIAIANPSAGTQPYTYSWSAPGGTRDSLTNLNAGSYTVIVTDVNHCTVTASGTVTLQTPAIIINEISQHDLRCYNDASGAVYIALVDTARNAPSYTDIYNWSNNTHSQNLTNVQAGTYTVSVTDQFGCTGTATYTLTQPTPLSATTTFTNPHCFGYADGTAAVVNPSGGSTASGTYSYAWTSTPVQNTQQATGLLAGPYTVVVSDDSLCTLTLNVTLTDPLAITFGTPTVTNPLCYGDSNGTALVAPQNGIGSYTYSWSYAGDSTNPVSGLPDGTYTVTATDANGCTGISSVTLVQPTQVTVSATEINVKCFAGNDGSATATGHGGTAPYSYVWNTGDSTITASNLVAGSYTVTATDNHGCSASTSTTVTQPVIVSETLSSVRTNCPDSKDGTITAAGAGGTGSYTYTLEDNTGAILQSGNTTGLFTGLGYGWYYVVVTDQNSCAATDTITVPRAPFNVYTSSADTVSCYGPQYHDGIIHVQGYSIPNGPFLYSVDGSPFQSIPDFFDLAAGPHQVTAQDNYGCDTTFSVIVGEPLPAVLQILPGDSTIEAGSSLQLTTVFGPYPVDSIHGYQWAPATGLNCNDCPNPLATPYANQTDFTLTVTYNNGCIATSTIRINANGAPPIYVPNAFTPNGDGVNDVWFVYGTGIKDFRATVFNRWGEKVFESDDQFQGWDGTYRGQLQPPNVYVYVVEVVYLSDEKATKKGSVTLIR